MGVALRWVAMAAAVYVVYAGILFLLQRAMLYPGTRLGPGPAWSGDARAGAVERVPLDAGRGPGPVRARYVPAPPDRASGSGTIIFHGNAELAVDLIPSFRTLANLGVSALFVEYPGFGGEPGRPTESSIMAVAESAYDWLANRDEVDGDRIFALGRSLGSGPAAGLTRRRPIRALVLWSPFVSVGYIALRKYGLPPFLALDRFDNRAALEAYDGSVLIFHGRSDPVIPFSNSEILAGVNPATRFVEWSCGHNDCPPTSEEFWDPLARFLRDTGLVER